MSEKLLPCPFCGHDTPEFERMGDRRQSCIVICGNCGARHESSDEGDLCGSSWNQRAKPTPSAPTAVEPPNTDKLADRALAKSFRENPREASLADQARMRRAIADPLTNRAFNMDGCAPTAAEPTPEKASVVEPRDERAELIVQAGEEMSFEAWFKTMCPVDGINAKIAARAAWQARASKGTK